MEIRFDVDAAEVGAMAKLAASMTGQLDWITSRAMTESARASKAAIERDIYPLIQGGPTAWTRRGLLVRFARPQDLTAAVGFNYGDGSFRETFYGRGGTPAGRYMEVQARGGDRRPKSTEVKLRRAGVIPPGAFITPARGLRLSSQGNVSGAEYMRILSRVRAADMPGVTANAPMGTGSRGRSGARRRQTDYFPLRREGSETEAIMKRVGPGPKGGTGKGSGKPGRPQTVGYQRGMVRALHVVDQPNYERRFPIQQVALAEYKKTFTANFEKAIDYEIKQQMKRQR